MTLALVSCFLLATTNNLLGAVDPKLNVILITIDTLRADHLGCYGFKNIETPSTDDLARAGIRFTHAYTPVPITLPAHTAILTGSFPMATGMHDFSGNRLPTNAITLGKVLREHGYTTAAFIGSAVLDSRFGLNQGFETYFDHFDFSRLDETNLDLMERRGDLVTDEALRWLRLNPRRPFLLWVHLYDPHYPYTPPEPYASQYRSRPYDGEIAFADAQVGRLLGYLRAQRIDSESLIILASDHGEALGEHAEKTHGFFIYNSTLHVPLIMKAPGVSPRIVGDEVSLVDIVPTALDMLAIAIPPSVQGRSLLGQMLGHPGPAAPQLYAESYLPLLHFRWSPLLSLRSGGFKYIEAPRPELYDTRTDPHELKNLFSSHQALVEEMRDRLFKVMRSYTPALLESAKTAPLTDPALLERLRSLGYVAVSATTFAEASGKQLPDPKDRIQIAELVSEALAEGQQGRYEESLSKLREAEKTEPALITIQYLKALDYYRLKNYDRAAESFHAVLRSDPKFALASYYLALTQVQTGDLDAAGVSFGRTLSLDPTNFLAAYNLGALYVKKNRIDDAIREFQHAITINPNYAQAYEALGELYLYQKRMDDAIRELEHAVSIIPEMRKAHYHLAQAYEAKGLRERAQEELQRARAP